MPTIIKKIIEKYNKLKLHCKLFFLFLNIPNNSYRANTIDKKEIQQMDNMQIIKKT